MNLARFLYKDVSKLLNNEFDPTIMAIMDAQNHNDFMCENYILNELHNTLYNVYCSIKGVKVHYGKL